MNIPSPRTNKKARIEIIPLIDIIFFLLATFVMVSLSMMKNKGIPVSLPVATSGVPQEQKDFVSISVTERGEIFWNKEKTTFVELPTRLKNLKATTLDPKIFLNGDTKAELGNAVTVLDEVRKAGISKVAIETKPKK
jgi:biopolymer transport protein ExbD